MPYASDSLGNAFTRNFQEEDGLIYFAPPGSRERIAVPRSDFDSAVSNQQLIAKAAKTTSFAVWGVACLTVAWEFLFGGLGIWAYYAVIPAFIVAFVLNFLAVRIPMRPFVSRYRDHLRHDLGWRPKQRRIPQVALLPTIFLVIGLVSGGIVLDRNARRLQVIDKGEIVLATVSRSDGRAKGKCLVEYQFERLDIVFNGSVVGCDAMRKFPVGSRIPVRFLASDPHQFVAAGEGPWPGFWLFSVIEVVGGAVILALLVADSGRLMRSK
ncbi:hypothetical protein EV283_2470 [Sphingomonas sp. BK036]|uniref:hypothetical protein n=1 Tax=Sphingomonas sp. BK036 TaxID=2512122 RepID=UPI0010289A7F|nr:hypothetical protein [Sphingomonas sp. BK036]RZT53219.1 hypothetical protein EV283_2470 [Sphingomonas sp. BK036]